MKSSNTATAQAKLDPAAMSVNDAARILSSAIGQQVSVEMIESDIAAGAPTNSDGTINLVHYSAWLVKESTRRAN